MEQIGNIINKYLSETGIEKPILNYKAIMIWPDVVGEQLSKVTHPQSVEDGKIFVRVENALWRNEITFSKQKIIRKLNSKLKAKIVKDIIFI